MTPAARRQNVHGHGPVAKALREFGRLFSIAVLAMLGLAGAANSGAAGRVFYDGFEDGTTNQWTKDAYHNLCVVVKTAVDGGTPHAGQFMAECNWNGVVAWNDPAAYSTLWLPSWEYTKEFFIRAWVRFDHDVAHTWGAKTFRLFPEEGAFNELTITANNNSIGSPLARWELNKTFMSPSWGATSVPLGDGAWHAIQVYCLENNAGATNGIVRVWIDGNLAQAFENVVSTAPQHRWSDLHLMSNWSNNGPNWTHGANNHVYWDDVEIYTDSGIGGVGKMSDASISTPAGNAAKVTLAVPSAPSDLRAQ